MKRLLVPLVAVLVTGCTRQPPETVAPPPVWAKNSGPTLAPTAMAALAFALGMDRRTPPRNGRLLRW